VRIHAFFVLAAATSSLASAAEPIHLAPSTPWDIDYAENSCRLIRHFGQGDDATTLSMESQAPNALDMLIISERVATSDEEGWARLLPLQSKVMTGMTAHATDKTAIPVMLFANVELMSDDEIAAEKKRQAERSAHPIIRAPAISLAEQAGLKARRQAFAAGTTAIQVIPHFNRSIILDTGSLGEPIKMFDQCSRDSLRDWGVDPDVEDKIVRPVWAPNVAAWFSPKDYPRNMLLDRKESVVRVRVLVDATGHVTKCTSLSHFQEPDFNNITCAKFTERAHFEPAELADGTKVPSYYVNSVVWRLAQ
jgi:hypothetical protein